MTRFGVMKHLRVLEEAGLVVTRRSGPGEAALPEPGADPADPRPVDRQVHRAPGLGARRPQARTGGQRHDDTTTDTSGDRPGVPRVHQGHARRRSGTRSPSPSGPSATATPATRTTSCAPAASTAASPARGDEGSAAEHGFPIPEVVVDGEVIEADPPRRLVQTWRMLMDPEHRGRGVHPAHLRDRRESDGRHPPHRHPRPRRAPRSPRPWSSVGDDEGAAVAAAGPGSSATSRPCSRPGSRLSD